MSDNTHNQISFDKKILVTKSSMPPYEEYIKEIHSLWDSHWLTNMGRIHKQLEYELKEYLEVPGLSLMVNGHMALELGLQAFGFPEGAEIITTPFTFVSTTHAIVRNRLKPVFCDIKMSDGTIDENKIEKLITEKTVAILPVHVYGNVCNVEAIAQIAKKYRLKVIYDAAHAFGIQYQGKGIGVFGDASIFSFHATKVFNTIEGGAVAFKETELCERLYHLKNFGIHGEELVVEVGTNAKMNEFAAAMGLCNLRHVQNAILDRKRCADIYMQGLNGVKGIRILKGQLNTMDNYGYMPILVEGDYRMTRDELYSYMKEQGICCRKYFYPITTDHSCFENKYSRLPLRNARDMSKRVLTLPIYEGLEEKTIERIISIIVD